VHDNALGSAEATMGILWQVGNQLCLCTRVAEFIANRAIFFCCQLCQRAKAHCFFGVPL